MANYLEADVKTQADKMTERLGLSPKIEIVLQNLLQVVPEVGCVQGCAHCSQSSKVIDISRIDPRELKIITKSLGNLYHQTGVTNSFREIYPYKDNDPGLYPYLDVMALLMSEHVGIPLRISTQGISTIRPNLLEMHKRIVNDPDVNRGIGRFRVSFTPGIPAFRTPDSRRQFEKDTAALLDIYRPMLDESFERSLGKRRTKEVARFAVFIRYNPKVYRVAFVRAGEEVFVINNQRYEVVDKTEQGLLVVGLDGQTHTLESYDIQEFFSDAQYQLYALDGSDNLRAQNFLWNPGREWAVATDRIRYFTLARDVIRQEAGISDKGEGATWSDVEHVIRALARMGKTNPHIQKDILPILESLARSYRLAGYSPEIFFHRGITKDGGVLYNQGRASLRWRKWDREIPVGLPTTDREYKALDASVNSEGEAYALVPQRGHMEVMGIDRIHYVYYSLGDPNLIMHLDVKKVDVRKEGNPRVGQIP